MVTKKLIAILMLVLVASMLLVSCGASQEEVNTLEESISGEDETFPSESEGETETQEQEDVELTEIEENVEVSEATIGGADPQIVDITTPGTRFSVDELTLNVGDSVHFDLGRSHNAVEVTQETWDANRATPKEGGFSVGFGGDETITFDEPGTYYYVCSPHVAMGMKATIIVQ